MSVFRHLKGMNAIAKNKIKYEYEYQDIKLYGKQTLYN